MGAPESGLEPAGQATAETLLTAFRTIRDAERARHACVLEYWLSIRGDKEFPPLHDLDPLELSDAGPSSILFELIGGGQDAEIRHLGDTLAEHVAVQRLIDAPNPSLLASIARKLPIVAISRDFLAFEDNFSADGGVTRCWVTLLPLSSCGSWVDYVYAFVSLETSGARTAGAPEAATGQEPEADIAELVAEEAGEATEAASEAQPGAPEAETAEAEEAQLSDPPEAKLVETKDAELTGSEEAEPEAVEDAGSSGSSELSEDAVPPELAQNTEAAEAIDPVEPAEPVEMMDCAEPSEEACEPSPETPDEMPAEAADGKSGPGFSRLIEGIANLAGFYGQGVKADTGVRIDVPAIEPVDEEPVATEPETVDPASAEEAEASEVEEPTLEQIEQPADEAPEEEEPETSEPEVAVSEQPDPPNHPEPASEGSLQNKLSEVRAKADEARQAQLRATQAIHEGLSAAYDFALDAETSPEEYLRLVEAQGMKIQLRAPMAPVAKLAFDGVCDAGTIKQFEAVLAWALKEELPRGALLERIEKAGGLTELLDAA